MMLLAFSILPLNYLPLLSPFVKSGDKLRHSCARRTAATSWLPPCPYCFLRPSRRISASRKRQFSHNLSSFFCRPGFWPTTANLRSDIQFFPVSLTNSPKTAKQLFSLVIAVSNSPLDPNELQVATKWWAETASAGRGPQLSCYQVGRAQMPG